MAVLTSKPTSPGRRHVVRVTSEGLHKGDPYRPLLETQTRNGGRNNNGRITTRHIGGGHKQHYRVIDFKRIKDGIPAKVERIEYDPNRSAHLALLLYADGERRYVIAPRGVTTGNVDRHAGCRASPRCKRRTGPELKPLARGGTTNTPAHSTLSFSAFSFALRTIAAARALTRAELIGPSVVTIEASPFRNAARQSAGTASMMRSSVASTAGEAVANAA